MKIRNGFVSNSSSSSFIVSFDQEINEDYLRKILYHNQESIVGEYNSGLFRTDDLCKWIMDEMKEITSSEGLEEIAYSLSYHELGWEIGEKDDWDKDTVEERRAKWEHTENVRKNWAVKRAKELFEDYSREGKKVYLGEFADDTTMGTQLERGGTFNAVLHTTISNH